MEPKPEEIPDKEKTFWRSFWLASGYIISTMMFGALVFFLNKPVYEYYQQNPIISPSAEVQNGWALGYVGLTIVTTFLIAAIVARHRLRKKLVYVIAGMFALESIPLGLNTYWFLPSELVIPSMTIALIGYLFVVFKQSRGWLGLPFATLMMTAVTKAFMDQFFIPTILIIPFLLAVWDIYAVLRGPLGATFGQDNSDIKRLMTALTANVGGFRIGFGDLFIYVMLVDVSIVLASAIWQVAVVLFLIYGGFAITIFILKTRKIKMLPALPLPVVLGLIAVGVLYLGYKI